MQWLRKEGEAVLLIIRVKLLSQDVKLLCNTLLLIYLHSCTSVKADSLPFFSASFSCVWHQRRRLFCMAQSSWTKFDVEWLVLLLSDCKLPRHCECNNNNNKNILQTIWISMIFVGGSVANLVVHCQQSKKSIVRSQVISHTWFNFPLFLYPV